MLDILGLFTLISGFVIGLGSVTVIDIHGFLGRRSSYWTEATTRTHKVTKPLIWFGMFLAILGGFIFYRDSGFRGIPLVHFISSLILILNGIFLSFKVSPFLLSREVEGKSSDLLPKSWQNRILVSLILSDIFWWGNLLLLVVYILAR